MRVGSKTKKFSTEEGKMKTSTVLGFALLVLGIISLAYQGITYTTHRKVLDLGPIQASKEEHKTIPLPPIVGAVALAGGIIVLMGGRRTD
jgi:hypothetical protein